MMENRTHHYICLVGNGQSDEFPHFTHQYLLQMRLATALANLSCFHKT